MKKFTSKILLLVMVLAMAFSLAACGRSGTYSSVEEYVNSDEMQSAFSSLKKSLDDSGMSIKISAQDNKMIYTYTYDSMEKTDDMAESLEKAMAAQDSTFQSTADAIKEAVGVDTASVVIEYIDCNGEMIYTKEYTAK